MMHPFRRLVPVVMLATALSGAALSAQQPKPVDEFVPIDQLPQQEQIPAANLLIPAYAFVWAGVLVYVVSLSRRLGGVERDVARLEADIKTKK